MCRFQLHRRWWKSRYPSNGEGVVARTSFDRTLSDTCREVDGVRLGTAKNSRAATFSKQEGVGTRPAMMLELVATAANESVSAPASPVTVELSA